MNKINENNLPLVCDLRKSGMARLYKQDHYPYSVVLEIIQANRPLIQVEGNESISALRGLLNEVFNATDKNGPEDKQHNETTNNVSGTKEGPDHHIVGRQPAVGIVDLQPKFASETAACKVIADALKNNKQAQVVAELARTCASIKALAVP